MSHDQTVVRRISNLGPLHDLIIRACPTSGEMPVKSISRMAGVMQYTPQGLYQAIQKGKVSQILVDRVMEVVDPTSGVTRDDFAPYLNK